jgi:hypothetical protein
MSASPSPGPAEPVVTAQQSQAAKDLYDQVFGGEGSDLSDTESEGEAPVAKRKAFPPRPAAVDDDDDDEDEDNRRRNQNSDDDDDDDDREGDGAYVPGTLDAAAKIPKFKKRAVDDMDAGEDDEGEQRPKDRKKKKTKKSKSNESRRREGDADGVPDEDEDAPALDDATRRSTSTDRGMAKYLREEISSGRQDRQRRQKDQNHQKKERRDGCERFPLTLLDTG